MINVCFSYDYELLWGVWPFKGSRYVEKNVRHASDALASALAQHQSAAIPANVAIVGMLLDDSVPRDLIKHQSLTPNQRQKLEALIGQHGSEKDLWKISAWLRRSLAANPWVSLGSHSYSHIYALDASSTELIQDFEKQNKTFNVTFGKTPDFLIMPKNQITGSVIMLAKRFGIKSLRINPDCWLYNPAKKSIFIRLLRLLDAYFPILELIPTPKPHSEIVQLLEGRYFFRPAHHLAVIDAIHFVRLKIGYHYCRKSGRDFHLWTHPHNMGGNIARSRKNLRRIFAWLKTKEQMGELRFCRMDQAGSGSKCFKNRGLKQAM